MPYAGADAQALDELRTAVAAAGDVLLDVFWVNDLNRVFTGRDINTGTQVGIGGRVASGIFLIPFTKIAKGTKVLKLGDEAAETGAQAAGGSATTAIRSSDDVENVLESMPKAKSRDVWKVGSVEELDELFALLTREGTRVPIGHGGPSLLLADGTRISRRVKSKTGGATIDIHVGGGGPKLKVHIVQ